MSDIEWGWVSRQLRDVRDKNKSVEEASVALLKCFVDTRDRFDLTDDEEREVLQHVQKLALGHAIIMEKPDERWGDVVPGEYNVGDTARVREDAYTGTHGRRHNGKRGRIIAVHQAKAVVLYDDAKNSEESFYHEPEKLQRLMS